MLNLVFLVNVLTLKRLHLILHLLALKISYLKNFSVISIDLILFLLSVKVLIIHVNKIN